ncbi:hypothetical protein BVX98_04380 [bacterium F11]|nr:hypothetical protein BVX98_04380 [bacterium F11]
MKVPLIDVSNPNPSVQQEIKNKIESLVDASAFVGGEEVRLFAEEFGAYCGGGFCAPVGNGTDALILALRALDIGPGDEVITVPFTFIATTEAISAVGAKIKFVDIDSKNYNLDIHLLEKAITKKSKAIIAVHLFGQPCDMDPIMEIAQKYKLKVIEDAAQAHGAEYKGRRTGILGDIACFSFYPTKNLGAFGDGGAVVSKSKALIEKVDQLSNHGRSSQYFHEREGVNSRLDSIQAGILRIKLRELDNLNMKRRALAMNYGKKTMRNTFISLPQVEPYSKHVFHLYCIETSFRDKLIQILRDKEIGCGVYYPLPLHLQPAYSHLGLTKGQFPISERASDRILAVPVYPTLSPEAHDYICNILAGFSPHLVASS